MTLVRAVSMGAGGLGRRPEGNLHRTGVARGGGALVLLTSRPVQPGGSVPRRREGGGWRGLGVKHVGGSDDKSGSASKSSYDTNQPEPHFRKASPFFMLLFIVVVLLVRIVCLLLSSLCIPEQQVWKQGNPRESLTPVIHPLRCGLLQVASNLGWGGAPKNVFRDAPGLRTSGVSTSGAAAKVMNFDRLGKKVRPGTFGNIKLGQREYTKSPCNKNNSLAVTPLVPTPFALFRAPRRTAPGVSRPPWGPPP